ncbi:MAG TPA: DcaP family trimeric outer membrane transporter, partial [Novosphingobium sp.]
AITNANSATLIESGTDRLPDFAARLVYTGKHGELSLAGLFREVRGETNGAALVNNTTTAGVVGNGVSAEGFGGSVGGKLFLNDAKTGDIRFIATYGQNIGRYVGLNFAPDGVYNPATNQLTDVSEFAALVSAHYALTPQLRANVMGSYQNVSYDKSLTAANLNGLNKQAWSAAANLFYSPVKNVDLGIEFRHGHRTTVSSATVNGKTSGHLDRIEFAAKYSF